MFFFAFLKIRLDFIPPNTQRVTNGVNDSIDMIHGVANF